MFSLCPPANVVWASDSPYGLPLVAACQTMRCAFQAGLSGEQVRGVMGAQVERMLDGEDPLDLGPPPGPEQRALDPLLDRVVSHLTTTMGRAFARVDFSEPLALSRLACAVGEDSHVAANCARGAGAARRLRRAHRAARGGPADPGRRAPAGVRPDRRAHARRAAARTSPTRRPRRAPRPSCTSRAKELAVFAAADLGRRGRGARRGASRTASASRACVRSRARSGGSCAPRARPGRRASCRSRARWCGRR